MVADEALEAKSVVGECKVREMQRNKSGKVWESQQFLCGEEKERIWGTQSEMAGYPKITWYSLSGDWLETSHKSGES